VQDALRRRNPHKLFAQAKNLLVVFQAEAKNDDFQDNGASSTGLASRRWKYEGNRTTNEIADSCTDEIADSCANEIADSCTNEIADSCANEIADSCTNEIAD
jgi:hypothetical protein